jgi:inorganic pyrophosphatase/exopolyphosphatase
MARLALLTLLVVAAAALSRQPQISRFNTLPCVGTVASGSRELLVIGTAHTPCRSSAEVSALIAQSRPDVVIIELDQERLECLLRTDEQGSGEQLRYGADFAAAVRGAAEVPIIEILDHHKLGGFSSHTPIHFWNNPVGSTSSIVALCFQNAGVPIPKTIAGLLMAGLISDTLNLSSPTTTATDRRLLEHLSAIAEVDPSQLAAEIFAVGSPLLTMTPKQAVGADSKVYVENGYRFSVAQIEELSFAHFAEKRDALLEELEAQRIEKKLVFSALLVTDINEQTSLLLVRGEDSFLSAIDYPETSPFIWELAGVVSRKKQLLPYLLQCVARRKSG